MRNNEEKMNASEYTAAKVDGIQVAKAIGILGNKKQDLTKTRFKTRANSTSPNANRLKEITVLREEPLMVTIRLGVERDNKPNRKGNVKKQVEIARSK